MSKHKLKVSNVKCGGCVSNIQKGLADMPGVKSVSVDIPTGEVSLEGDDVNMNAIREKLRTLGYTPVA